MSKHLKSTRYAYLGFPYWDWTKNSAIPTLFDGLKYPNVIDRMIDLKRGGTKKKSIQVYILHARGAQALGQGGSITQKLATRGRFTR